MTNEEETKILEEIWKETTQKGRLLYPDEIRKIFDRFIVKDEWIRKEDVIAILNKWADGYCYIEIPTKDAIKAIVDFNPREGTDFNDYLAEQLKDPNFKKQWENALKEE